jgi:hypothetical protein
MSESWWLVRTSMDVAVNGLLSPRPNSLRKVGSGEWASSLQEAGIKACALMLKAGRFRPIKVAPRVSRPYLQAGNPFCFG